MPKRKKVLFITGSTGSGHILAAKAIQEALLKESTFAKAPAFALRASAGKSADKSSGIETTVVDAYNFISYFKRFTYRRLYQLIVSISPKIYHSGREIIAKKSPFLENFFKKGFSTAALNLKEFLQKEKPDFVIATHGLAAGIASLNRKKFDFKLGEALTDFSFNKFHIYENIDFYYLPTEEIKEKFLENNFSSENGLIVSGIPIRSSFSEKFDKEKIREELGFEKNRLTILLTKGSFGWDLKGKTYRLAKGLAESGLAIQLIISAGYNKKLFRQLSRIKFPFPVKIFGFTERMPEIMELADIEIGKPGGVIVSESLTKSLPFVIHDVLPGPEEDNAEFLINKGIGFRSEKPEEIAKHLDSLLKKPEDLRKFQEKAFSLGRPGSSRQIARHILENI